MTCEEFKKTLTEAEPPGELSPLMKAMWYDKNGNWDAAHELADRIGGEMGDLVHAYLHRVEGDQWNANYWYKKAGRKMPEISLEEEWEQIVIELFR